MLPSLNDGRQFIDGSVGFVYKDGNERDVSMVQQLFPGRGYKAALRPGCRYENGDCDLEKGVKDGEARVRWASDHSWEDAAAVPAFREEGPTQR